MKKFVLLSIIFLSSLHFAPRVYAIDLDPPNAENADEDFDKEFSENGADDNAEATPEDSAENIEAEDAKQQGVAEDESKKETITNDEGEVIDGEPEDVLQERKKEELNFKPGLLYQQLGKSKYSWNISVNFGTQAANVADDFETDQVLPDDYNTYGFEVSYHFSEWPVYAGFLWDHYAGTNNDTLVKDDFVFTSLGIFVGYKFTERVVTVSAQGGLLLPSPGTSTVAALKSGDSTESVLKFGVSYYYGILTSIYFKGYFVGLDSGWVFFNNQNIDGEDFSQNVGGYIKTQMGMAF